MTIRDEAPCISPVHGLITYNQVQELSSKQEETDTKIFLCAKFAASLGFESASIITFDSDVAIVSIVSTQIRCETFSMNRCRMQRRKVLQCSLSTWRKGHHKS